MPPTASNTDEQTRKKAATTTTIEAPIFYGPEYGIHPTTPEPQLLPPPLEKEIDEWTPKFFRETPWSLVGDALPALFPLGRVFVKMEQLLLAMERLLERHGQRKKCLHRRSHFQCTVDLDRTANAEEECGQWKIVTETINPKPRHYYVKIVQSEWMPATAKGTNESTLTANNNKKKRPSPYLPPNQPSFAVPCRMLFSNNFSDITLHCQESNNDDTNNKAETTKIPAHRVILGMASPVWHHHFTTQPTRPILTIPFSTHIVKQVLSLLYQGTMDCELLEQNLETFRKLSHVYQLDCIPKFIHHRVYQQMTFDNIREKLLNLVHSQDRDLIHVALTFIKTHPEQVLKRPDVTSLATDHPRIWQLMIPGVSDDPQTTQQLLNTVHTTASKNKSEEEEKEPASKKQKLSSATNATIRKEQSASAKESTTASEAASEPSNDADAPPPAEWQGEILFRGQLTQGLTSPMVNKPEAFSDMNILSYLNPLYKGMTIAFDPNHYPVGKTAKVSRDNPGWMELKKDLIAAARTSGQELRETSVQKGAKRTAAFNCQRSRHYCVENSVQWNRDKLIATAAAAAADGSSTPPPKKSKTVKPTNKEHRCPFRFNLGVNAKDQCFYLTCGAGNATHKFHAKLKPGEKLPKTETNFAKHATNSQVKSGTGKKDNKKKGDES